MSWLNEQRSAMYARAEFYAWSARKGFTQNGNDPLSGLPFETYPLGGLGRRLGRATNRAAAAECYRQARAFPCPLP